MKQALVAAVLFFLAAGANAATHCSPSNVQVQPDSRITVVFCEKITLSKGDKFNIDVGGVKFPVEADLVAQQGDIATTVNTKPVDASDPSVVLLAEKQQDDVTVLIGSESYPAKVIAESLFTNYRRYQWAVGPAETGDKSAASSTDNLLRTGAPDATDSSGAGSSNTGFRVQYSGEYANGHPIGTKGVGWQTIGTLAIDTTDKHDPSFIDNNRGTFGVQLTQLSLGGVVKQGRFGVEARASKAAHRDIHDFDGAVKLAGWLPIIPAFNFMNSSGNFVAPPLSFSASFGYRNRDQEGENFHGPVFEGTALYHVFALDRINLDVNGTWTVNRMSNRPATTPRTQRLYKAAFYYLQNPDTGFAILTTIEDGSAGVMLTKVRQYFLGLALSKINFSGGSK